MQRTLRLDTKIHVSSSSVHCSVTSEAYMKGLWKIYEKFVGDARYTATIYIFQSKFRLLCILRTLQRITTIIQTEKLLGKGKEKNQNYI